MDASTYTIQTTKKIAEIKSVEIDPSQRMADMERKNNKMELARYKCNSPAAKRDGL